MTGISIDGNAANVTGVVAVANGGTGLTAAGTKGQVLTSTGTGLAWSVTYIEGLNPDLGGYVFYVTPDGKHGLVAATQDQSPSAGTSWFNAQNIISDPANHDTDGKKFTDWRLPTRFELNLLYEDRTLIGNFQNSPYWSSTMRDGSNAWYQDFSDNSQFFDAFALPYRIRAVRSF